MIQGKRNHNICDVRLDYGAEVLEDAEIKELVRYIHLNPLRARVVSDISGFNRYAYCGHSVLTGERGCTWQDTSYVLKKVEGRVTEVYEIDSGELYLKGRQRKFDQKQGVFFVTGGS